MSASSEPPLPHGWVTQVSRRTGMTYWFNTMTGQSSYERPVAVGGGLPTGSSLPPPPHAPYGGSVLGTSLSASAGSTGLYEGAGGPPQAKRPRLEEPAVPADVADEAGGQKHKHVALAVAAAYDAHEDRGIAGRKASSILHLKNFNNWVKATLIAEYAPRPARRVLDLACGKLGDIQKWRLAGVERYCGVDISGTGIRDGRVRFNTTNARAGAMAAKLVRADLGATLLRGSGVLAPGEAFDVISIQFALHYLFQTEHRALTFFRNVADALAPGGVFLGTIPDAAYLIRRLRDLPRGQLKFGNSLYYVAFDPATAARQYAIGDAPYGLSYDFFLAESVEHVKEYVVPWPLLTRLAAAAGLEPLANDNFHAFYERMRGDPRHATALQSMKVMDCEGTISEEEWEAAGVYRVFAFRKVRSEAEVAAAGGAVIPPAHVLFPAGVPRVPPHQSAEYHSTVEEGHLIDLLA